jgi:hypothetical protein
MAAYDQLFRVDRARYGDGLFAARRFRAGQTIAAVAGEVIDDPEYGSDYCIDLGRGRVLEPSPPFAYLNHGCEPNCQLVTVARRGKRLAPPEVLLDALRTIEPGEQLTIDYAWPAAAAIRCLCGAACCRGWIVDADELPLLGESGESRAKS